MTSRLPFSLLVRRRSLAASLGLACVLTIGGVAAPVIAAPGSPDNLAVSAAQNVGWMGEDTARTLDIGFSVLVPGSIPSPFSSSPSVSASGGYYQLYWGPSGLTFLQIEGIVGGALPAGSEADLNNQLSINASVRGYEAIHDLTDVYDTVWWIEGGVRYKVSGRGLDVGSLDIANSLMTLVPPAQLPQPTDPPAEEPVPEETPVVEATEATEAPDAGEDTTAGETPEPETGETPDAQPTESIDVVAAQDPDETPTAESDGGVLSAPETVQSGSSVTIDIEGAEASDLIASDGVFPSTGGTGIVNVQDGSLTWRAPVVTESTLVTFSLLVSATGEDVDQVTLTVDPIDPALLDEDSDGTGGAEAPAIGGDGTSGPLDVTVPFGELP